MAGDIMSIRVEPELKKEVQKLCKQLGISTSLVVNTYFKKFLEERKLTIGYDDTDPRFYQWGDFVEVNEPIENVIDFLKKTIKEDEQKARKIHK